MGQRPFVVWESKGSTRSFSLLLPQLDRQQISLKQVTIKQHLKSGSRSGPRGKRRMNLQKVLENLPPSLLTPSHLVFLLFKNSPLPCYHHHPLDTPNYQELNGVNGAGKGICRQPCFGISRSCISVFALATTITTIQEVLLVITSLIMVLQVFVLKHSCVVYRQHLVDTLKTGKHTQKKNMGATRKQQKMACQRWVALGVIEPLLSFLSCLWTTSLSF